MKLRSYILAILLLVGIVYTVYIPEQSDFYPILIGFSASFAAYFLILKHGQFSVKELIILAIILRLILLPAFPNLSNDIYRFLWDGLLLGHGYSPFAYLPTEIVSMGLQGLNEPLYALLNSPDYYSIYPPITQLIYGIAAGLSSGDVYWAGILMRCFLIAADIGIITILIKLLPRIGISSKMAFWYALNPLLLVELVANLHFEGLMIFFLLLSLKLIWDKRFVLGGIAFTLSVGTKLLPLMFLPFIWRFVKLNKSFLASVIVSCILLFTPIIIMDFAHFAESIDLYFGKFEFNGSVYYALRALGYKISGYNLIRYLGPLLGLVTLSYCIRRFFVQKENDWAAMCYSSLTAFSIYLFLATTIHPWYLALVLFWNVFIGQRFVLLWSYLIVLTYINYSYSMYHENLWIVFLEYFLVIPLFIYENRTLSVKSNVIPSIDI